MIELTIFQEPGCEDIEIPRYHSEGASGFDLPAAVDNILDIPPGEFRLVSTGLRMEIPKGFEGQVRPRSGLAAKNGIGVLNSPGTIDSDYRGIVKVVLFNFGKSPFTIKRGDRIAQIVLARCEQAKITLVSKVADTNRGAGGFGHTGV